MLLAANLKDSKIPSVWKVDQELRTPLVAMEFGTWENNLASSKSNAALL